MPSAKTEQSIFLFIWNLIRKYGIFFVLVLIIIILSFASEYFFTVSNLMNILLQSSNIGIMAVGMTFVIIAAEIDLSVASLQSLGACLVAVLIVKYKLAIIPSILLALMCGIMAGGVSGFFTGRFAIPAFITTLAMDSLARGSGLIVTQARSIFGLPTSFAIIAQGYVGPVPVAAIIAGAVFLVGHIVLTKTTFGLNVYAIGGNKEAASYVGISVGWMKAKVLMISGFCAALAGIIMASRLNSAQAVIGLFDLLDVIAAVVIGGTSLMGGEGTIVGTFVGTMIISVIRNGLNLLGIPADWQMISIGIIIVLAVLADYIGKSEA